MINATYAENGAQMLRIVLISALMFQPIIAYADDLPYVPSPQGFVESSTLVPALKEQALIGQPQGKRVIGVYLLPAEQSALMQGTSQGLSIYCRAYVVHEYATEEGAKTVFQSDVVSMKKSFAKPFDPNSPEDKRMLRPFNDYAEKKSLSVGVTEATNLGSIMETSDVLAVVGIVTFSTETGPISVIGANALIRDGKHILELTVGVRSSKTKRASHVPIMC
jgi:hypothetical protein